MTSRYGAGAYSKGVYSAPDIVEFTANDSATVSSSASYHALEVLAASALVTLTETARMFKVHRTRGNEVVVVTNDAAFNRVSDYYHSDVIALSDEARMFAVYYPSAIGTADVADDAQLNIMYTPFGAETSYVSDEGRAYRVRTADTSELVVVSGQGQFLYIAMPRFDGAVDVTHVATPVWILQKLFEHVGTADVTHVARPGMLLVLSASYGLYVTHEANPYMGDYWNEFTPNGDWTPVSARDTDWTLVPSNTEWNNG